MQGIRNTKGYNHEGYLDMTAYKALSNIYKGDRTMTGWNDGDVVKLRLPNREYVYRVVIKAHERYATTLNLYDTESYENGYSVKVDGDKKLHADLGKIAYTKSWDMDDSQYVRSMAEEEFEKLLRKIGDVLGIPKVALPKEGDGIDYKGECAKLQDEIDTIFEEKKKLEQDYEEMRADMDVLVAKNAKLMTRNTALTARASAQDSAELDKKEKELRRLTAEMEVLREELKAAMKESSEAKASIIKAEAERDVYKDLYKQVLVKYDL